MIRVGRKNRRAAHPVSGQWMMEFPISEVPAVAQPVLSQIAHSLRKSVRRKIDPVDTDHDLLARFVLHRDETAFRSLVSRYAKLVLTACRQVLSDPADIDDAFQATFLVLLKKAKRLDASAPLAGWLFSVAHRTAVRCRTDRQRRTHREAEAARRIRTTATPDLSWREAGAVLHDELNTLPEKYRMPLLLCSVQGLTRDEAAEQLGTTVGAIRGQLERGRALLERRLTKRGVVLSAGLLAVLMGSSRATGGPSAELIELAVRVTSGHASACVTALAQGAFPMMTALKQAILPVIVIAGLIAAGFELGTHHATAIADEKPAQKMVKPGAKADPKAEGKKQEAKERTITGKVVGPDGQPVQAELIWNRVRGKTESLGKTKEDGTFSVTVQIVDPGAWLVAKADGYGLDFVMPGTNTPAEVTFQLTKDVPIRGRLIDPQGKAVTGAAVQVRSVAVYGDDSVQPFLDVWKKRTHFRQGAATEKRSWWNQSEQFCTVTTDTDGRFEITGMGGERFVGLKVSGGGRAETDVHVITRAGFDPKPFNDVTLGLRPPNGFEKLSWAYNPLLSAPDFTLAVEPEKLIRGRLTDATTGQPREGVEVMIDQDDGNWRYRSKAATDADGRYELRGARKWGTYELRTMVDPTTGHLPCRIEVKDTIGYEPVVADVACPKGVVVTGTVRNKATGEPVAGRIQVAVLAGNESVKDYPTLGKYPGFDFEQAKPDGTYRLVVIPGPMLLACGSGEYGQRNAYKAAKPDPKYTHLFKPEEGGLMYYGPGSSQGIVNGNVCKVVEAKLTDTELVQDFDLEPATRKDVKVVDADGKPVKGVHATGISHQQWHYAEKVGDTDTITAINVEPESERLVVAMHHERKLVGATTVKEADAKPVVTLGSGGTVKGRVVDDDGKPLAGIAIKLYFDRREVAEVYGGLNENRQAVTDMDGKFEFETLLPGYQFRFLFSKGKKSFSPDYEKAPRYSVGKHGETKDLGDQKIQTRDGE